MDEYKGLEVKLESAYFNRNKVGTRVDKYDLVDAAKVIEEDVLSKVGTDTSTDKIVITQTINELKDFPIENNVVFCKESSVLYRYISDISTYLPYGNTIVTSNISGGWIEHDSLNKFMQPSNVISLEHINQSSSITLTSNTDFTAKMDSFINNGHTHVCKLFCNGFTPTFSGFTFLEDSSPLELVTLDTAVGFYHTIVFFKMAGVNQFIIINKVASADTDPPVITVNIVSTANTSISFSINSSEQATLKWALYSSGSSDKTTIDIDNGTGALQHNSGALVFGNNALTINSLTQLTTYDLWQYAIDTSFNASNPTKTVVQTAATGSLQLSAPVIDALTIIDTASISVPISGSSIDSNATSVSIFYKKDSDLSYTSITGINKTSTSYTLTSLTSNTVYNVYLVAVGNVVIYSDSVPSNIATATTKNVAPTLDIPYTTTNGLIIELPFSRAMSNPSAQSNLFTVSGGKSVSSVALKSGDSTKIQVTVDSAYIIGNVITISIASGLVPADNGIVYSGVTNQSVTNNVANNKSLLITNSTNYITSTVTQMPISTITEYSISMFVKHLTRTSVGSICTLSNGSNVNIVLLTVDSTGSVSYQQYSEGSSSIYKSRQTTTALPLNQWTNIVVTINGTTPEIYFNGVIQPTSTVQSGTFVEWATPSKFTIGAFKTFYFNGNINDVSIINRKISASEALEIATLDNGVAKDIRTTSLSSSIISYYRLNNNNLDATSLNTTTNVGTPVYSSDSII